MQMQNLFNDNLINCPPGKLVLISAFIDTNLFLAAKGAALEAVHFNKSILYFFNLQFFKLLFSVSI